MVLLFGVIFLLVGILSREGGSVVFEILCFIVVVDVSVYLVLFVKFLFVFVLSMEIGMMLFGIFSFGLIGDESSYGLVFERLLLMVLVVKSLIEFSVLSKEELCSFFYVKFSFSFGNV